MHIVLSNDVTVMFVECVTTQGSEILMDYCVYPGYGGPHAGFFAIRDIGNLKRSLPGRLIGVTRYLSVFDLGYSF